LEDNGATKVNVEIIKTTMVSTTGICCKKGMEKGEAIMVVPTSSDHHEPHEIIGPLNACTLVIDGNLKSLLGCKKNGVNHTFIEHGKNIQSG
jgi:hypothetical protein